MYENKCFMGYVINKDKERLKEQLVNAMIDFRDPKYSIVEVWKYLSELYYLLKFKEIVKVK